MNYDPRYVYLYPASIPQIVAHIQDYLKDNPIVSTATITQMIINELSKHPEVLNGAEIPITAEDQQSIKDYIDHLPSVDGYTKEQVNALLDEKQNALTFDQAPTPNSSNPVTSSGISTAITTAITTLTALINLKANLSDVYTKSVIDQLLSGKANAADVYTKTEANQLLAAKVNAADVYTKTETDTLLNDKADETEVTDLKSALTLKVDKDLMQKCELIDIPASANKFDLSTAKVGYLHTNGNVYTGGNYDNYKYNSLGSVSVGDVIKSWKYTNGTVSALPMQMAVAYDSNGNVMSSAGKSSVSEYTVPNGVASVSVTFSNLQLNENVMVTINGETPTQFIPYAGANQYYQATKAFLPSDTFDDVVSIDGVNQVTAQNAQFIFTSANLFDESTVTDGYIVNQVTGELNESATNSVSDFIPVIANSVYTLSMTLSRQIRFFWYDADKNPIPGSGALTSEITEISITSPANAAFIRFSTSGIYTALIQFEKGATATEYTKFGTAYLLPQYAPPADMALNLPDKIYALVGYELNIYFENIAENWENYTWDVSCAKGMQLERGYRVTPEAADVGTYPLVIIAKSGNMEVNKTANLIITSATAGSGDTTSLIVLGDSTTANGIAITKLNENFSNDVMSISTLGTRGTAPNNHEGRSGWTFNAYFNPPNDADVALGIENPWYNPTTHTFDANYYFTTTGIAKPDWLFINLGINDTFSYTNDAALLSAITTIKGQCDSMIASILSASPSTKIGLCLTIPPNDSQDAFGKAYKTMQTRDRYKRNNFIWVHDLIETYGDRESESIYLVPIFTNLDTVYNMGLESNLVNSRNSITYESPIGNGGVHPAESGYWQIADVYTTFLKAQA